MPGDDAPDGVAGPGGDVDGLRNGTQPQVGALIGEWGPTIGLQAPHVNGLQHRPKHLLGVSRMVDTEEIHTVARNPLYPRNEVLRQYLIPIKPETRREHGVDLRRLAPEQAQIAQSVIDIPIDRLLRPVAPGSKAKRHPATLADRNQGFNRRLVREIRKRCRGEKEPITRNLHVDQGLG